MFAIKPGDLVVTRRMLVSLESRIGIVLSVSTQVPYEGAYARVLFNEEVRNINTSFLEKVN